MRVVLMFLMLIPGMARAITYPFSTIDMPGFYKLATNIPNQITISTSNVTLDMNGSTVSGGTNGIVINSGLSNITIKNGVINSVSSDGIQVNAGCNDITLKDITVSNALRGIYFSQVTNGLVRNCDMNQSTTGLQLDTCHNITFQDCTARANTHAGYDLLSSTTCSLIECQSLSTGDGNSNISAEIFGFISAYGNGNIFECCIANSTMALSVTGSDSIVAGFALRGSESGTSIIESEASNTETNVNGFTVPYGILLEGTLDSTQSVTGLAGTITAIDWSPDGQYIAVGGGDGSTGGTNDPVQIFLFDQPSGSVTSIAGILASPSGAGTDRIKWSPDGNYVAIIGFYDGAATPAFKILSFDRPSAQLKIVAEGLTGSDSLSSVDWSPDGLYLAVSGTFIDSGSGNELQIFKFDRATERLTVVTSAVEGLIRDVTWSPDGQYVAVGGNGLSIGGLSENPLLIFRFDRAAGTLTKVAGALTGFSDVEGIAWSPDGNYIAIGGFGLDGGTNDDFQLFRFDRSGSSLISIDGALSGEIIGISWSPNGTYIAIAARSVTGGTGNVYQIFRFDEGQGTLTAFTGALSGDMQATAWSPDGQTIAVGGQTGTGGTNTDFQIFSGIQFPENNVIKGNTVYCNSGNQWPGGVGISAPSITNLVIGNAAYNNPIPRGQNAPIVESNYQFVTNVFDQLFGEGPSAIQNIAITALNPLPIVPDLPSRIKRTELLLESLIDNLL